MSHNLRIVLCFYSSPELRLIGGSKGGARDAPPRGVPILSFSCSFRSKNWLAHLLWELAPPPWKILDPPLKTLFPHPTFSQINLKFNTLYRSLTILSAFLCSVKWCIVNNIFYRVYMKYYFQILMI